jgi:hypothetical protein
MISETSVAAEASACEAPPKITNPIFSYLTFDGLETSAPPVALVPVEPLDTAQFARERLGFESDARQIEVLQSKAKRAILNSTTSVRYQVPLKSMGSRSASRAASRGQKKGKRLWNQPSHLTRSFLSASICVHLWLDVLAPHQGVR